MNKLYTAQELQQKFDALAMPKGFYELNEIEAVTTMRVDVTLTAYRAREQGDAESKLHATVHFYHDDVDIPNSAGAASANFFASIEGGITSFKDLCYLFKIAPDSRIWSIEVEPEA